MSQFLETIRIIDGRRMNLKGHASRMNACLKVHFPRAERIDLDREVIVPDEFQKGLVKCRVIYEAQITSVAFQAYHFQNPRIFKIMAHDTIHYSWKSTDRRLLDSLYEKRGAADDIIVSKKGIITDTYYANILLRKGGQWFTPASPLLKGTMREMLIKKGKVSEAIIKTADIFQFEELKIINAMVSFDMHAPVTVNQQNIIFD